VGKAALFENGGRSEDDGRREQNVCDGSKRPRTSKQTFTPDSLMCGVSSRTIITLPTNPLSKCKCKHEHGVGWVVFEGKHSISVVVLQ
jgi:hypothetical protein